MDKSEIKIQRYGSNLHIIVPKGMERDSKYQDKVGLEKGDPATIEIYGNSLKITKNK